MIEDDIRAALLPAFDPLEVIFAYPNGPRPDGMYATLRIESAHTLTTIEGSLEVPDPIPAAGARALDAHRTGMLEVQVFGSGAYEILDVAIGKLATEESKAAAWALNLAFGVVSDVEAVPALRNDSTYEERAVVSLAFAYTRRTVEALHNIETVEGEVDIANSDLPAIPYSVSVTDN